MPTDQEELQELIEAARDAADKAYCPYSGFAVGAAVLAEDGRIFSGCNVENASYGLTICAERNALAHAVSQGVRAFRCVVVYRPGERPVTPCGACRQMIAEFGDNIEVVCVSASGARYRTIIDDLIPQMFTRSALEDRV